MKVVRPRISRSSASTTACSVSASSALVGSSRIRIGAFFEQRPGDGEALALAARQRRAALAEHRVVALRQRGDEVVGVGGAGRGLDLVAAWRRAGRSAMFSATLIGNRNGSWSTTATCWRRLASDTVAHVVAVEQHPAGGGIDEARDQADQRALARAGLARPPRPSPRPATVKLTSRSTGRSGS